VCVRIRKKAPGRVQRDVRKERLAEGNRDSLATPDPGLRKSVRRNRRRQGIFLPAEVDVLLPICLAEIGHRPRCARKVDFCMWIARLPRSPRCSRDSPGRAWGATAPPKRLSKKTGTDSFA
jgi:hypothetical protein